MSDIKKEDESESSEIFNEEEKIKKDIISSSSDEENNQNQNNINTYNNKDTNTNNSNNNNYENANGKLLGNKRHSSKERKGPNDYGDSRKKIKKYNNNNNNNNGYNYSYDDKNNFQPSLDIPLLTFDLHCETYKEKFGEKNNDDLKKMYEEYKLNHEQKNNEQFFNHHKNDEWFLEKYNPQEIEKPIKSENPHIRNSFKRNLLKTKKRKTNAVIESAIQALDKDKPSQNDRKISNTITNEE